MINISRPEVLGAIGIYTYSYNSGCFIYIFGALGLERQERKLESIRQVAGPSVHRGGPRDAGREESSVPGPQKYVKYWPLGPFLEVLGHYFTSFGVKVEFRIF